ncbi:response regulator [Candidatus Kaiserbacteria bacterium]|nr:response regulator [Candidatus Kaiserbacteria bacterium]
MAKSIKNILVIEDEKPMAKALELKLTHSGFAVTVAHNGEDGLTHAAKEQFDLILCDLVMPKADGFQVLETLKERNTTTPVIILTNLSQDEDQQKVFELGAKGFLVKSDTPVAAIVEEVGKILA